MTDELTFSYVDKHIQDLMKKFDLEDLINAVFKLMTERLKNSKKPVDEQFIKQYEKDWKEFIQDLRGTNSVFDHALRESMEYDEMESSK
ncbi:hypothetical protein ABFO59_06120 [Acinetobacter radioresistens]|uniref:hypothetical protein n=1 Tax=Acinetobacter radioresistens TaxID=40216 RepID=UPI0032138A07